VAMDIEIGTGGMIVTVIETEVRGIGATVKIVTEETGLIETVGDRSMSVIENESTGIDPHHLLGIGVHVLAHRRGIGEASVPVVLIWHPQVLMLLQQGQYQVSNIWMVLFLLYSIV
jgi:hypothetical protein